MTRLTHHVTEDDPLRSTRPRQRSQAFWHADDGRQAVVSRAIGQGGVQDEHIGARGEPAKRGCRPD